MVIFKQILLSSLFLYILSVLFRKGTGVFFILPIVFIIFEVLKNIFIAFSLEYGFNGIQNITVFLIVGYLLLRLHKRKDFFKEMSLVLVFLFYSYARIPFGDDLVSLITKSLGLTSGLLLIPISALIVKEESSFYKLNNSLISSLIIYVTYLVTASIFKFGPNHYDTDIIYGLRFEQYYLGSIAIVMMPVILNCNKWRKKTLIFLSIITFIILVLTLRRTAVIIVILGLVVYFTFLPQKRKRISNILGFVSIILIVGTIFFNSSISDYRSTQYSRDYEIEEEGRYIEMDLVLQTLTSPNNNMLIFGSGKFFNDKGEYGFRNDERPIHGAISKILFGAGLVGVGLFLLIFIRKVLKAYKFRIISHQTNYSKYRALLISLIAVFLAVTFTGGLGVGTGVAFTGTIYIYIGALSGLLQNADRRIR